MSKGTVLVIDDDRAVRQSLSVMLGEEGFRVAAYVSGPDCLQNCDFRDIICAVVDYHLPGMNGVELAALLRKGLLDVPVILLSSMLPAGVAEQARAAGIQAILRKPLDIEDLCRLVHAAHDLRPHAGA